eukprot:CAMPEP_0185904602 /NCGR_PEP_ID=MMETSP0196C-20130402/3889_1 /TAXON_ID=2932 /ORGANISM="Alexandrium fundyense, Strain CCMP1719" /LENGTH=48 /DNA_ID= /DNA_START= /DNA_END= /DNA_ORIENTATION=
MQEVCPKDLGDLHKLVNIVCTAEEGLLLECHSSDHADNIDQLVKIAKV